MKTKKTIDYRKVPKHLRSLFRAIISDKKFCRISQKLLSFYKENYQAKCGSLSEIINSAQQNANKEIVFTIKQGLVSDLTLGENPLTKMLKEKGAIK